jgi:hypothetical protein
MFNAARPTVTLLVEGALDAYFWRHYAGCPIEVMGGGSLLDRAKLKRAREQSDAHLLGIADADLNRIEPGLGGLPTVPDLVWTDAHDLETTLAGLPTLEKLVGHEVGGALATAEQRWGETFRARLFAHARELGRLRWLKVRVKVSLVADGVPEPHWVDDLVFKKPGKGSQKGELHLFDKHDDAVGDDWAPSPGHVLAAVLDYGSAHALKKQKLREKLAELPEAPIDQVCNGHDIVGFLRAGLKALKASVGDVDALARSLCLACEEVWLRETSMWQAIRAWEALHPGFRVLKSEVGRPPSASPAPKKATSKPPEAQA